MRTVQQVMNVRQLIAGLGGLPADYENLDMTLFADSRTLAEEATLETGCGTSACIVGHGPSCGVPIKDGEPWLAYSHRVFGFGMIDYTDEEEDSGEDLDGPPCPWRFCFSSFWPNSIPEAIARLKLANRGNIPNEWDYKERYA